MQWYRQNTCIDNNQLRMINRPRQQEYDITTMENRSIQIYQFKIEKYLFWHPKFRIFVFGFRYCCLYFYSPRREIDNDCYCLKRIINIPFKLKYNIVATNISHFLARKRRIVHPLSSTADIILNALIWAIHLSLSPLQFFLQVVGFLQMTRRSS